MATVATVVAVASGCSSNALIKRRRELPVEAQILGGSVNTIFVRDSGGEATIERIDIADVDHPGTGMMAAGPAIALSYFLPLFPSTSNCAGGTLGRCMGAILPFTVGLAVFAKGVAIYSDSVAALKDQSRFDPDARPVLRGPRKTPQTRETPPGPAPAPSDEAAPAAGGP